MIYCTDVYYTYYISNRFINDFIATFRKVIFNNREFLKNK